MAHGCQDASAKKPILNGMRQPERLHHVPPSESVGTGVVSHPANVEHQLSNGGKNYSARGIVIAPTEQWHDLTAQIGDGHREGGTATITVIQCFELAPHVADPLYVAMTDANFTSATKYRAVLRCH